MEFLSQEDFGLAQNEGVSLEELQYSIELDGHSAEDITTSLAGALNTHRHLKRLEALNDGSDLAELTMEAIVTQIDAPMGAVYSAETIGEKISSYASKAWKRLVKLWKKIVFKTKNLLAKIRGMFTSAPNYSAINALLKNPEKFLKKTKGKKLRASLLASAERVAGIVMVAHRRETFAKMYGEGAKSTCKSTINGLENGGKKTILHTLEGKYAFKGRNFTLPKDKKAAKNFSFRQAVKNQAPTKAALDRVMHFGHEWPAVVAQLTRVMGVKGEKYGTISTKIYSLATKDLTKVVAYYSKLMTSTEVCQAIIDSARTEKKVGSLKIKGRADNDKEFTDYGK